MFLSIIIPTKDRKEIFAETLRHTVAAVDPMTTEIIVVNDSKTSTPHIPEEIKHCKLVDNPKSGVAAARNFGVKTSRGDLILFLDDDILISKQSIDHIRHLHEQYAEGCFNVNWTYPPALEDRLDMSSFGRFLKQFGMNHFKGWFNDPTWRDNSLFEVGKLASFHLSISKINFEKTGGYEEQFPFAGFEDYDFPIRMKRAGLREFIDSRVTVFHNEADRLQVRNWLDNWTRRAATRKVAVKLGYAELSIHYGKGKILLLTLLSWIQPFLLWILHVVPNKTSFDSFYFRLLSGIQAIRIFNGYRSDR